MIRARFLLIAFCLTYFNALAQSNALEKARSTTDPLQKFEWYLLAIEEQLDNRAAFLKVLNETLLQTEDYSVFSELHKLDPYVQRTLGGDEHRLIGLIHYNLAYLYYDYARYERTKSLLYTALFHLEKIENKTFYWNAKMDLGKSLSRLGENTKAIEVFEDMLSREDELGLQSRIFTRMSLGLVHRRMHNYSKAIKTYSEVLNILREQNDTSYLGSTLSYLGILYYTLNDLENASLYLEESVTLPLRAEMLLENYHTLSKIAQDKERIDLSLVYAQKQMDQAKLLKQPLEMSEAFLRMGELKLAKGELSEAVTFFDQAYDQLKEVVEIPARAGILMKLAQHQLTLGVPDRAKSWGLLAAEQMRAFPQTPGYVETMYMWSSILRALGAKEESLKTADILIEHLEKRRNAMGLDSKSKLWYQSLMADIYRSTSQWYLSTGRSDHIEVGFHISEMLKSRSLNDELSSQAENLMERVPESLRLRKEELEFELTELYASLNRSTTLETQSLLRQINEKERAQQSLMDEVATYMGTDVQKSIAKPVTIGRTRQLFASDVLVLSYLAGKDTLSVLAVGQGKATVYHEPIGATLLFSRIESVRKLLENAGDEKQLRVELEQLSKVLLRALPDFKGISKLMIVPDGRLALLPFEALRVDGQYLIEKVEIKYAPSVTSLTLIPRRRFTHQRLLTVAHPDFSGQAGLYRSGVELTPLPFSKVEADSIALHFKTSTQLFGSNATERKLYESGLQNYRYLHFATHGIIDEQKPELSGLALSYSAEEFGFNKRYDGFLSSSEIYGMKLNADLVVLSACNTNLGKSMDGEGLMGLQRAFLFAGSSSVLVSQWSVLDRSTALFMGRFYQELIQAEKQYTSSYSTVSRWFQAGELSFGYKAEALRKTKLQMLKSPYAHPVHWASFVLIGD